MRPILPTVLVVLLAQASCTAPSSGDSPADPPLDTDTDSSSDADTDDVNGSGSSGLEEFCERYKECGGTFYETAQDCVDATTAYWGECPDRRAPLDTFGDCMKAVPCEDYEPDGYDPSTTVCASEYAAIASAPTCD